MFTNSNLIDQAVVYGDNKPYLVALILNEEIKKDESLLEREIEIINNNLTKIEN